MPQILPKGLNTLKGLKGSEMGRGEGSHVDLDFRPRSSLDVRVEEGEEDRPYQSLPSLFDGSKPLPENVQITPYKKQRNSKPNTKIMVMTDGRSSPAILPGVLLTYNMDHMNLGDPKIFKSKPNRSDSIESSEV
jgi:hypothetical protein